MSIQSVMPSNHLILCHPLLLLPSIFPSIRVFSNELALHIRWPKYWSFSFNISPSNEHPRLISFRMDWLDLLAVQGTLKNLLQHHRTLFPPNLRLAAALSPAPRHRGKGQSPLLARRRRQQSRGRVRPEPRNQRPRGPPQARRLCVGPMAPLQAEASGRG